MQLHELNEKIDSGLICGLCHEPTSKEYSRHFRAMNGEEKHHNYCSERCKAESYEFQDEEQDIMVPCGDNEIDALQGGTVMTFQTLRVLNELKRHVESIETDTNGVRWGTICVSNIKLANVTSQQIPGYLSQLTQRGFYRKINKYFGLVKLG